MWDKQFPYWLFIRLVIWPGQYEAPINDASWWIHKTHVVSTLVSRVDWERIDWMVFTRRRRLRLVQSHTQSLLRYKNKTLPIEWGIIYSSAAQEEQSIRSSIIIISSFNVNHVGLLHTVYRVNIYNMAKVWAAKEGGGGQTTTTMDRWMDGGAVVVVVHAWIEWHQWLLLLLFLWQQLYLIHYGFAWVLARAFHRDINQLTNCNWPNDACLLITLSHIVHTICSRGKKRSLVAHLSENQ